MLDITGLIPLVWRSLVNILPDINGFPLLGVQWAIVLHRWISFGKREVCFHFTTRQSGERTEGYICCLWWYCQTCDNGLVGTVPIWYFVLLMYWYSFFYCTISNEFVSNSSVTLCSHAPGQYDRYILSGKSMQMSIHDNGLVLVSYPFTGFLAAQSIWIHQWSMCLIITIICKDLYWFHDFNDSAK